MQLQILRQPEYLSPSGYSTFNSCNHKYFLRYMSGIQFPRSPQGGPAGVGSAFDSMVKAELATILGLGDDPKFNILNLLKDTVEPHNEVHIPFANRLFETYKTSGRFDSLVRDGIRSIDLDKKGVLTDDEGHSVPYYVRPDLLDAQYRVCELKVRGALSNSGASPTPGFRNGWRSTGKLDYPHERYKDNFDLLHPEWAGQLLLYTWSSQGLILDRPIAIRVEECSVRGNTITFTTIESQISVDFAKQFWKDYYTAWDDICNGRIRPAAPCEMTCMAYNQLCEAASHCEAHHKLEQNPDLKFLKS